MNKSLQLNGQPIKVVYTKRKNSRGFKIRIRADEVHVSLPYYTSYAAAEHFVSQNTAWITKHIDAPYTIYDYNDKFLFDGTFIQLQEAEANSTSRKESNILIKHKPGDVSYVEKVIYTYLKKECMNFVLPHIDEIGVEHALHPEDVRIKRTIGRWGSCSSDAKLSFSSFLVQLPDELIRYVVAHELSHIMHLNHSSEFWQLVQTIVPDYRRFRKEIKNYKPQIYLFMNPPSNIRKNP